MEPTGILQLNAAEATVGEDLQHNPHILLQIAENSLTVAEGLRDNYFRSTARFVGALRSAVHDPRRDTPLIAVRSVAGASWADIGPEVVTFIDAGIGSVAIASRRPLLLRVGSYCVRTGERRIAERERFGYYPVILGDLEGGSKAREDFPDLVRTLAELLGGLIALERTPDLDVLLFHGPIMPPVGVYAGHTPFTERDIDRFLGRYALTALGATLKAEFLDLAARDIYPRMTERAAEWADRRLFEPLAFIAYLYRRLIRTARDRVPAPLVAGVVERAGRLREFSETVLLERVYQRLRARGNDRYFDRLFGRNGLTSPGALLEQLGYTDALLLTMLLEPGEFSEPWEMRKAQDLHAVAGVALPDGPGTVTVDYTPLRDEDIGFPRVLGCYLRVSETTAPVRLELLADLGSTQAEGLAQRAYLYARLLPGYGFPVGLDIADKYAHVPRWLLDAYGKLIRHHLGVSVQRGEVGDAEMRRLILQALYFRNRDWLFRPPA